MPVDWNGSDMLTFRRQLELGRAVLFAGAGFSIDAKNRNGESPPLGGKLAELLAQKAGLPYHGDSLANVYEATRGPIGENNIWRFLDELYSIQQCAPWYRLVTSITWHRIYTTNIDTLFQCLAPFDSKQRLRIIVRGEPPQERDPLFEELQCVHLHGHVQHRLNGLTFSPMDFAKHTARPDPWYQALVNDLEYGPVVFIGTTLEEPILNHYLELRDQKDKDRPEWRPKSYLVSPHISLIKAGSLRSRNIHCLPVTAQDFFESLAAAGLPSLDVKSVQARVYPQHFAGDKALDRAITAHFDQIVPGKLPPVRIKNPSRFFLGAEPTWVDIEERRDGERIITQTLVEKLAVSSTAFHCLVLIGPAGSGKTTSIMRVAHELATQGHQVFFARGYQRLDINGILEMLEKDETGTRRVFIFIDVVSQHMGSIVACKEALQNSNRLTLVAVDRTNRYASSTLM